MRPTTPFSIGLISVALVLAPISAADAHGFRHHGFGLIGGLFGLAGAVVVGAATIATAPIAILAHAASGGGYRRYSDDGYDQRDRSGYQPDGYNSYGDRRPYGGYANNGYGSYYSNSDRRGYDGRESEAYGPRQPNDVGPRGYERPDDYDRGRPDPRAEAYNAPAYQNDDGQDRYSRRGNYDLPRDYNRSDNGSYQGSDDRGYDRDRRNAEPEQFNDGADPRDGE